MLRSMFAPIAILRSPSALRFGGLVSVAAMTMVVAGSASGQSTGTGSGLSAASQAAYSGGGGRSSGGTLVVEGAVGQVLSGRMQGGTFQITSGFMSAEGSLCELADFNCDNLIDGSDLGVLLYHWGPCPDGRVGCTGDFNCDGNVNGADLGVLLHSWG